MVTENPTPVGSGRVFMCFSRISRTHVLLPQAGCLRPIDGLARMFRVSTKATLLANSWGQHYLSLLRWNERNGPCEVRSREKECAPLTCVALVFWDCQKRICSIWALLRRSIWFASSPGSMVIRSRLPGFRLLKSSTTHREEFASNVKGR